MSTQNQVNKKNISSPEETHKMEKGKIDIVNIGNLKIAKFTFEPGWSWEKCEKPVAKTESCQLTHQGYLLSGQIIVKMVSDGKETEFGPGDVFYIPPGHDAQVIGNEPVVGLDISNPTE